MTLLEREVEELRELVDGQEPWSHRRRLHLLEDDKRAGELVRQALDELRAAQEANTRERARARNGRWDRVREWGGFVLALAAATVAILVRAHGG